jgi:hypothetical protein
MSETDDNVVDLDEHRVRERGEFRDEQVAYLEALWGKETWAFNVAIRDLEKLRRGVEDPALREPQTYFEVQKLVQHIRGLANDLARNYGFDELVRGEDDDAPAF